jgi:hypothetical protein
MQHVCGIMDENKILVIRSEANIPFGNLDVGEE